ncbi:hypothetical protein diail_8978 [Diaporthe ilicicola]|nr:hypothetical protein diail_8978 [Diaporthe ilicicola]
MAASLSLWGLVLTTLGGVAIVFAQTIPAGTLPYTIDKPYQEQAKSNGLAIEKPNIIIFMPDQLRLDSVGVFGSDIVKTPNIDSFAKEGTRFTNAFSQASVCSQSRCSMFTGQYPHVSGHRTLNNLLKPNEPNVFRSLKEGGYHVAYLAPRGDLFAENATELSVSEYGYLEVDELPSRFAPEARSLDEYADDNLDVSDPLFQLLIKRGSFNTTDLNNIWNRLYYQGLRNETEAYNSYDAALLRGALKWLENPPKDQPWVLFLPLLFPHCPFTVEEPWFSMYNRSEMPLPIERDELTGHMPQYVDAIIGAAGLDRATDDEWREVKATYYGMISKMDSDFGKVVNKTKELGLWDQTVTLFFTDHGEWLGDYGLIEKWPSALSNSLTHDPLIIGGAGLPEGKVFDGMVEMVDLVPTLLQLATTNETYMHYGESLVDVIHALGKGGNTSAVWNRTFSFTEGGFLTREEPLLEYASFPYDIKAQLQHNQTTLVGMATSMRSKEWTYIYRIYEADELYSRADDPGERNNLADVPEYQDIKAKLKGEMMKWIISTSDVIPWYMDSRTPDVSLPSPNEQYVMRLGGSE